MARRIKLAFLWDGVKLHQGKRWKDGLWLALERMKESYFIRYFEPSDYEGIKAFNPDLLLFWGAFVENIRPQVVNYPYKKAICFAGGPIERNNVDGWDMYFVESAINEAELANLGKPFIRAFGVNEEQFKPMDIAKKYLGIFAGTFALWKRHELFAEAIGSRGIAVGAKQAHEPECHQVCDKYGVKVLDEVPRPKIVKLINQSELVINPSSYWGGGQRLTLEAMACNVPPVVMSDSPKNREYVEESGYGYVVEPDVNAIKSIVSNFTNDHTGRQYIESKWTSRHYALALDKGLKAIL
jgi:glycosyltransferase involved in cell wall biosynthesis